MSSTLRSFVLAAAMTVAALPAHAEQSAASAAAKGRIAPVSVQVADPTLPPAARKAVTAKVEALVNRALATPTFNDAIQAALD